MKEELTTLMHADFFDDPEERLEILVMGAACCIHKGEPKDVVLKKHRITEEEYNKTFARIFPNGFKGLKS